jgi:hypothetical protein
MSALGEASDRDALAAETILPALELFYRGPCGMHYVRHSNSCPFVSVN